MYVLGVFKYLYNDEFEKQQQKKFEKFSIDQPFNQTMIKIEERKLREEEFMI